MDKQIKKAKKNLGKAKKLKKMDHAVDVKVATCHQMMKKK